MNFWGNVCHGPKFVGDRGAMTWTLLEDIKDFVVKQLYQSQSILQIIAKHIELIKEKIQNCEDVI